MSPNLISFKIVLACSLPTKAFCRVFCVISYNFPATCERTFIVVVFERKQRNYNLWWWQMTFNSENNLFTMSRVLFFSSLRNINFVEGEWKIDEQQQKKECRPRTLAKINPPPFTKRLHFFTERNQAGRWVSYCCDCPNRYFRYSVPDKKENFIQNDLPNASTSASEWHWGFYRELRLMDNQ